MQDITPTHRYNLLPEVAPADLPQVLQAEAMRLVEQNDLEGCLNLAEWAYAQPSESAIPALCTLLQRPQPLHWRHFHGSLHRRRLWRREGWIRMRIQAIHALERISGPEAAVSVANALMYDCPEVRPHAAAALQTLRTHALLPLLHLVCSDSPSDWPLEGMVATIDTLSELQDKNAGPTLAHVLFGDKPLPSSRHLLSPISRALLLSTCELSALLAFGYLNIRDAYLVEIVVGGSVLFAALSVLNFFVCFPISVYRQFRQRIALYKAASGALTTIQDKMSVPSIIEIALGTQTSSARPYAHQALLSLLPLLNARDAGLLTGLGRSERLLTSAFSRHDPPLILAIVRALEFVGTGQSANQVERLANRRPTSHDALAFLEIRAEAERILPILQDRQRREQASSILLRASTMPNAASEQLLRPAHYQDTEQVEQLLRPHSGE